MQTILMFTVAVHVLSGIFWAGSTFVLARIGRRGGRAARPPAIGRGRFHRAQRRDPLEVFMHAHSFQPQEWILASGACCAIIAAGIQGTSAARMKLAHANAVSSPVPEIGHRESAHCGRSVGGHGNLHGIRALCLTPVWLACPAASRW